MGEALKALTAQFADLKKHLYNDEGKLRSFVNVYVNDEDIRFAQKDADAGEGWRRDEHRAVDRGRHGNSDGRR